MSPVHAAASLPLSALATPALAVAWPAVATASPDAALALGHAALGVGDAALGIGDAVLGVGDATHGVSGDAVTAAVPSGESPVRSGVTGFSPGGVPVEDEASQVGFLSHGCEGANTTLEGAVCTATGPVGLGIIAVYSFLIAFILPLPSEIVLPPAASLNLGLPVVLNYVLVILVSGAGKAAGSVFAFHIGQEAKQSGPVVRALRRSRFDVVEWSESKVVQLSQRYGYFGLALALSVPGFPDTLSIYAFSVLEEDYVKFAAATFAGSVGRLLVTIAIVGGGIALL